jgi:hypothetical protein
MSNEKDQQHPLYSRDRALLNNLLNGEINDYNLAELARLRIRYYGFPGARDIQQDLDKVLQAWKLTQEELYEKTRQIHSRGLAYKSRAKRQDTEDWS